MSLEKLAYRQPQIKLSLQGCIDIIGHHPEQQADIVKSRTIFKFGIS